MLNSKNVYNDCPNLHNSFAFIVLVSDLINVSISRDGIRMLTEKNGSQEATKKICI